MRPDSPAVPRHRRPSTWLLLAAVVIAAVAGWRWFGKEAPAAAQGPSQTVPVRVAVASQEPLVVRIKAMGTVTALHTVHVRSRVDGELMQLAFKEGQQVKAGDLLARIDPRPYEVQLAQALGTQQQNVAELDNARRQLKRFHELQGQNYVSAQELSDQQSKVRQLEGRQQSDQAAVDEARLQLQYTRITAPVAGRMGLRNVDVGNLVRSGDTDGLVTITQTTPISVLFTIPETEVQIALGAVGGHTALPVEAWDREERRQLSGGTLASLDNRIDTATGTLKLRAHFDNADEALFPNQFVNVRLQVGNRDAVVIPNAAVQFGSKGTYVYVIGKDNTSSMRPVKLGAADGERVAVAEGLQAGEQVVLEGIDRLRDGATVEIISTAGAQDEA